MTETDAQWWTSAVFYQVYPRSFADGNGDGTGDLLGVREHIDYLAYLGIEALWLSPFYPSPMADGGYDVADPCDVDPAFGTLADFDALLAAAHGHGIRVTIDIVPNHVSEQHPWFQQALAAGPGSPERARFIFRPGRGAVGDEPPNNWPSQFGGPAWTRVADGEWYLHLFAPEQPDLDWTNPAVADEFDRILGFWLDRGVDGFRIDVAHGLAKEPGLPDMDLALLKAIDDPDYMVSANDPRWDRDAVHAVYRRWRRLLDGYPGARMAVGEAWVPDPERLARYVRPDELNLTFNFALLETPWGAAPFRASIESSLAALADVGAPATWVLANHDVERVVSRYGGGALGLARARAAALIQLSLPGAVYIYNGDELGLDNVDLPDAVLQDPIWERSGHTARGRDGERVPLPWSGSAPPFGFTTGASTWLPQPASWVGVTVSAQVGAPASMLELYRAALRVRRESLSGRDFAWLDTPPECLAYRRGPLTVLLNAGPTPVALPPGEVVLASGPLTAAGVPTDTAVWVRRPLPRELSAL